MVTLQRWRLATRYYRCGRSRKVDVAATRLQAVHKQPEDAQTEITAISDSTKEGHKSRHKVAEHSLAGECSRQRQYVFACGNDVIDLRTGAFRPGRRWDMLTNVSPIYWVPEAESELWLKFLGEIFPGRPEMITFIKRAVGYSMTGLTREGGVPHPPREWTER